MGRIVKVPKGGFEECPFCGMSGALFGMGFRIEICNNCKALIYYFKYKEKEVRAEIFEAKRIN